MVVIEKCVPGLLQEHKNPDHPYSSSAGLNHAWLQNVNWVFGQ